MEEQKVLFHCEDHVGYITLNVPQKRNAISRPMAAQLKKYISRCESDPDIHVVVFTGGEDAFCSGGDVSGFDMGDDPELAKSESLLESMGHVCMRMKLMDKLVITAVGGVAAGGGEGIALSGDYILAGDNARFIQTSAKIGLVPDMASTYLLAKAIGPQRALELCLSCRTLGAQEALELGLVKEVCPKEELMERTRQLARELAAGPLVAYQGIKRQLRETLYADYEDYMLRVERETMAQAEASQDYQEGVAAFMEKRKPVFQGR